MFGMVGRISMSHYSWLQLAMAPDLNGDLVYSEKSGLYGAYFVVTGASFMQFTALACRGAKRSSRLRR